MSDSWHDIIERERKVHGLSMAELSRKAGVNATYVSEMRRKRKVPHVDKLKALATVLGIPMYELLNEELVSERTVPLVGRVGADTGGQVLFDRDQDELGRVFIPQGATSDSVAIEVIGLSMGFITDGSLIFYSKRNEAPTDDMIGETCIVGLHDGRVLLKRILRGSSHGLFDLESINGPMIRDVQIQWAAHIESIVPRHRARQLRAP